MAAGCVDRWLHVFLTYGQAHGAAWVAAPDHGLGLVTRVGSFLVLGLHEADGLAAGLGEVRVVEEPVHGCGGDGFGHEFVEAEGVDVGADREEAFLVGGFHDAVEPFGGVAGDRQLAYAELAIMPKSSGRAP
jgi:hypothetical protein